GPQQAGATPARPAGGEIEAKNRSVAARLTAWPARRDAQVTLQHPVFQGCPRIPPEFGCAGRSE
ncbi:MAG TPA: hypothetical protein VHW23_20820, partial [Kofleriaceae bacterium]|nr:hypothetical protein [Kofleriaceae bacterium]